MRQPSNISNHAKAIALFLFVGLIFADALVAFYILRERITPTGLLATSQPQARVFLPNVMLQPPPPEPPTPIAEPPTATPEVTLYTVKAGDTLFQISQEFEVCIEDIQIANDLSDVNLIYEGQQLIIPRAASAQAEATPTP